MNKTKTWSTQSYAALIMIVLAFLVIGSIWIVKAYSGSGANNVTESITVNGDYIVEAAEQAESAFVGFTAPFTPKSDFENVRVSGPLQRCDTATAGLCRASIVEVQQFPTTSSSLRFTNNRSTSSTAERLIIEGRNISNRVSSTLIFSCGNVNANPGYAFDSAQGTRPSGIADAIRFTTGSAIFFDSFSTTTPSEVVGPGESVDCLAQYNAAVLATTLICPQEGVECESVTSSNRGWQADVTVVWGYIVSSSQQF